MEIKSTVLGLSEIQKVLDKLPAKIERRVHNNGLRAAGRVLQKGAKSRVPQDSGDLGNSIVVRTRRNKVVVGFEKPHSRRAHLTEYGAKPHTIEVETKKSLSDGESNFGKTIQHPGSPAQPFMRPTLELDGEEAIKKAGQVMGRGVEREAAKEAGTYKTKRRKK